MMSWRLVVVDEKPHAIRFLNGAAVMAFTSIYVVDFDAKKGAESVKRWDCGLPKSPSFLRVVRTKNNGSSSTWAATWGG